VAKQIKFVFNDSSWAAGLVKLDRDKVYGYVEEVITDANQEPCAVASLLDDGHSLVLTGSMALKTVDDKFNEVDKKSLKAFKLDGTPAELVPSSYDADVLLMEGTLDDLFNLETNTVYQLAFDDEAQEKGLAEFLAGKVMRFVFNYRADYEGADAVLIAAQGKAFALTGRMLEFPYLENKMVIIQENPTGSDDNTEETIDFGML
jgi:hypothetical protein